MSQSIDQYNRIACNDLGECPQEYNLTNQQDTFAHSGGNTYTLSHNPSSSFPSVILLNGIIQDDVNYTISGTTLTITTGLTDVLVASYWF